MMTRYAITHINRDGMRTLTFGNQARKIYDTMSEALIAMELFKPSLRDKVLGTMADSLEVRPVDCYEHGDAKGVWFDD